MRNTTLYDFNVNSVLAHWSHKAISFIRYSLRACRIPGGDLSAQTSPPQITADEIAYISMRL
jgi:hypothetical protein